MTNKLYIGYRKINLWIGHNQKPHGVYYGGGARKTYGSGREYRGLVQGHHPSGFSITMKSKAYSMMKKEDQDTTMMWLWYQCNVTAMPKCVMITVTPYRDSLSEVGYLVVSIFQKRWKEIGVGGRPPPTSSSLDHVTVEEEAETYLVSEANMGYWMTTMRTGMRIITRSVTRIATVVEAY